MRARLSHRLVIAALFVVAIAERPAAHKPITSPYTFSADVRPILYARCGRCHRPGGVAPMSLLTHIDTLPWGESLRIELMAGHMPPWRVDRGATRFRNPGGLSARELNVLLTWITGGTPPGDPAADVEPASAQMWALGQPDAVLQLPRVTLGADEQERTVEFVMPVAGAATVRALDLLPGTPAVVRSATIAVQRPRRGGTVQDEDLLSLWVPGDEVVPVADGAFTLPPDAKLSVRVRYRKTWEYERREMTDESRIGLYFAPGAARPVQRVTLAPGTPVTLGRASRALAIYPDPALADTMVVVTATRPDGRRDDLIAFHPRRGWARRYWFQQPVSLPRGTRLSVRLTAESRAFLPPGFTPPPAPSAPTSTRVYVNLM